MKHCALVLGVAMGLGACQSASPVQPPPGSGGNFYVDAIFGDDAAAGDSAHPFKTVQHAADIVNPGDVVVVRNGVYTSGGSEHDVVAGCATALDVKDAAAAGVDTVPHHDHIPRVHAVGGVLDRLERMGAVPGGGVVAGGPIHVVVAGARWGWCHGLPARPEAHDDAKHEGAAVHGSSSLGIGAGGDSRVV